jgi:hypothetical protein
VGRNISGGCDILMKNAQGKKKKTNISTRWNGYIILFFFGVWLCVWGISFII